MLVFAVVAVGLAAVFQAATRWVLRVRPAEVGGGIEAHVAGVVAAEGTPGSGRRCMIAPMIATPLAALAAIAASRVLAVGLARVVQARAIRDVFDGIDALEPVVVRAGDRVGGDGGEADEQAENTHARSCRRPH